MSVVKKLKRDLGLFKLEIRDWEILDKGVTALWGPSGAGKSTIVNALLGLDSEAELDWSWGGENLSQLRPPQRNLGVVFQEPGLFPHMTVRENILFPVDKKKHVHWVKDFKFLTENLDLKKIAQSPCYQISGGEAQRVALARALIYRPRLLILDEAFSSLDLDLRRQSRSMLLQMSKELLCPILMISHDLEDVEDLANKISYLEQGKLIKEESLKG